MYLRWQRDNWGREGDSYKVMVVATHREPGRKTPRQRVVCYLGRVDMYRQRWKRFRQKFWEGASYRLELAANRGKMTHEDADRFRAELKARVPPWEMDLDLPYSQKAPPLLPPPGHKNREEGRAAARAALLAAGITL